MQVILVDDGSTDESSLIAQHYAKQMAHATYVRQANAGLGAARNHGLRLATGRYVGFLDSDDLYPRRGLDHLLHVAVSHKAKIAVGDMHGFPPRPSPPWRRELTQHPYDRVITSIAQAPDLIGNPSPCNKVFSRYYIESMKARFTEQTAFEDVLFTSPLLLNSDRTVITPRLAYLYRQRGDGTSIMDSRSHPTRIMQHLRVVEELVSMSRNHDEGTRRAVERWTAYMQLHYAWRAADSMDDGQFNEFCTRMAALFKHIPVQAARQYAQSVKAALRTVAIYECDVPGVRHAYTRAPLRVHGGRVYAGHANFDHYRSLLELKRVSAEFTGIRVQDRYLRLMVRCTIPQLRVVEGEERPDLVVGVGSRAFPLVATADRTSNLVLTCGVRLEDLANGRHKLSFAVNDHGATATRPARLRVRTRPIPVGHDRHVRLTCRRGVPCLVISSRRSVAGYLDWALMGRTERAAAWMRRRVRRIYRGVAQRKRQVKHGYARLQSRLWLTLWWADRRALSSGR